MKSMMMMIRRRRRKKRYTRNEKGKDLKKQ